MSMFKRKALRRRDPIPRREGPYLFDWLKPGDILQIARMEKEFFPQPYSLAALIWLALMPNTYYIVIRRDRLVVAYIGFRLFEKAAHTNSMCVHPDYRRRGLARRLQLVANEVAVNRGARWFTGEVRVSNTAQLNHLMSMGWLQVGHCPRFFKDGEDVIVVWKWL